MVVVLARKLRCATVKHVERMRQLRHPRRLERALLHPCRQRLAMAALTRDAPALVPPLAMQRLAVLEEVLNVLALHIVRARIWLVARLEHAIHNENALLADLDLLSGSLATRRRLDRLDVGREANDRRAIVVALASRASLRVEPVGLKLGAVVRPDGGGRVWLKRLVNLPQQKRHHVRPGARASYPDSVGERPTNALLSHGKCTHRTPKCTCTTGDIRGGVRY
eukprot:7389407-Prymnesium_polylepis.2